MKIKATRTFRNDIGMVRRGDEVTIRDADAKSLIRRGLAVEVEDQPKPKAAPQAAAKSKTGAAAPKAGD